MQGRRANDQEGLTSLALYSKSYAFIAKPHPTLPSRSLASYHLLHFNVTISFNNHPVN